MFKIVNKYFISTYLLRNFNAQLQLSKVIEIILNLIYQDGYN